MSAGFVHRMRYGAALLAPDRTRFCLWAPSCAAVTLVLGDGRELPMEAAEDGWFELEVSCGAGTRYRFRVDDGLLVPDPASRLQVEDVHGDSVVVDPAAYAWRHAGWKGRPWHETVLYELHAGVMGGFAGVEARLAELAALGVTAVELMPVADFPGSRNWGYDGVLPFAPDTAYGDPTALKSLIDAAHGHGLMVFLDVVYNHFGPEGNYLGAYAASFFRQDRTTPWGAAIDFRLPQVRRFFIDNALYWLNEYRVDGLRLDAVHAIASSDWLEEFAREVRAGIEPGRHVHLVLENDDNAAGLLAAGFDAQWNDDLHHVLHVLLTGESEGYYADYADGAAARLARALAEGFVYQGEDSGFRGQARGEPSAFLPPTAFVAFLQNHDQIGNRAMGQRLIELAAPEALRAAVALLLLAPQIPLLFMGEERGCRAPFLYFASYTGELADAVREGRRREFAPFAAFRDPARRAAIPDPNAPETFDASVPDWEREDAAWSALYRGLLALRRREIVPRLPGARALGARTLSPAAVLARWRLGDGSVLSLAANFAAADVAGPALPGRVLADTSGRADPARGHLPGYAAVAVLSPEGGAHG